MKIENYTDYMANQNDIIKLNYKDFSINVKKYLSLAETIAFVESVTESCIDSETGTYHPEVVDFLIRNNVFTNYTDIELPEDMEEKYNFVYRFGDVYYKIIDSIDSEQFSAIINSINSKIKYVANANVEALNKNASKFMDYIMTFGDEINKSIEGIDKEELKNAINIITGAMYNKVKNT